MTQKKCAYMVEGKQCGRMTIPGEEFCWQHSHPNQPKQQMAKLLPFFLILILIVVSILVVRAFFDNNIWLNIGIGLFALTAGFLLGKRY